MFGRPNPPLEEKKLLGSATGGPCAPWAAKPSPYTSMGYYSPRIRNSYPDFYLPKACIRYGLLVCSSCRGVNCIVRGKELNSGIKKCEGACLYINYLMEVQVVACHQNICINITV